MKSKNKRINKYQIKSEKYLCGKRILPKSIVKNDTVAEIINDSMLAYNGGRLRAACLLLKEK